MKYPKIVQGNAWNAIVSLFIVGVGGEKTPIDVSLISGLDVKIILKDKELESVDFVGAGHTVVIKNPADLPVGSYAVTITGTIAESGMRYANKYGFDIVKWNEQSNLDGVVSCLDVPLEDALFILSATDGDIATLEEQLRKAIAEAEAAKEEWERKAEEFDGRDASRAAYEAMKRLQPYLYEIEYSELDYEGARAYFATHYIEPIGACTQLSKGNLVGRNYDWNYNNSVEFRVTVLPHNKRYGSFGTATSVVPINTDTIGEYKEEYKYLPFHMLDGVNEKGLYCGVNMIPYDENLSLPESGTVPTDGNENEWETICSYMLVRYVLDNFATPKEACEYIQKHVKVYPPKADGKITDLHFALKSKEQLYYLCFWKVNGVWRTEYVDVKSQPLPFVMTNFPLHNGQSLYEGDAETGHYNRKKDSNYHSAGKYAIGFERANKALDFVRDLETEQSVLDFMCNDLKYTNTYRAGTVPQWLTELADNYVDAGIDFPRDIDEVERAEDVATVINAARDLFEHRSRETGLTWQTVHSVVYDLDTLTMQLVVQEGNTDNALTIDCFKSLPATKEDVENIPQPVIPTDYAREATTAKQGNNPSANLSAIQTLLENGIAQYDATTENITLAGALYNPTTENIQIPNEI